jgi:hypothetical protein
VILQEIGLESRNNASVMQKAREEADDFLLKIRKQLI